MQEKFLKNSGKSSGLHIHTAIIGNLHTNNVFHAGIQSL